MVITAAKELRTVLLLIHSCCKSARLSINPSVLTLATNYSIDTTAIDHRIPSHRTFGIHGRMKIRMTL
jgi:hypothetical protein